MAESLKRLAKIGTFSVLQEKLERWVDDFNVSFMTLIFEEDKIVCFIFQIFVLYTGQYFT